MQRSDKSFGQTLKALLEERDLSQRELARRTQRHDKWGTAMTFTGLIRGDFAPTMSAMESIARALQIKPETFCEYRLAKARHGLDPQKVGLKKALHNLGE